MTVCPVCCTPDCENFGDLCKCPHCGHLFQFPAVVTVTYDAGYLARYEGYPTEQMSYLRLGFLKAFVSSGRILDIGYGTGTFLRIAAQVGFDCYGVEVHGVARGVREVALNAEVEDWDVVTFFDSLEHFRNFDDLRGIFARSRFVMVSVPLTPPAFPERREWRHYKPGEHLHYFCAKSLRKLIGKSHVIWSNLEDAIRSPIPGRQNILTGLFTNERLAATSL